MEVEVEVEVDREQKSDEINLINIIIFK